MRVDLYCLISKSFDFRRRIVKRRYISLYDQRNTAEVLSSGFNRGLRSGTNREQFLNVALELFS